MDITNGWQSQGAMAVKVLRGTAASEIKCSYLVDETSLEFTIQLPKSYPLRSVKVEGTQSLVKEARWRRWLLNIATSIAQADATHSDALRIWKQNADQHFAGIEDCAICYSIVGALDKSLPSRQCSTCKHKFHAGCLVGDDYLGRW